jgi:hypothetical protein
MAEPPHGPRGWSGNPQAPQGPKSILYFFFFFFLSCGSRTTPLGHHGGGRPHQTGQATPLAKIGAHGGQEPPPSFLFFFSLFIYLFSLFLNKIIKKILKRRRFRLRCQC